MRGWLNPAIALAVASACATPSWHGPPYDQQFQVAPPPILHPAPPKREVSPHWDRFSSLIPESLANPLRGARILGASRALDVNDFGEVIDSPWFENRIGRRRMTAEEITHGPNRLTGPAPGPLLVLSGKSEGVTPGLVVKDSDGHTFLVKVDAPAFRGLGSGAEVIATKLLYAAGYHVPENYLVDLSLDRLVLGDGATTKGRYRQNVPLDAETFAQLLNRMAPSSGGTPRTLFSRIIDGTVLGPFPFEGASADDPNDRIPHERRRSVRGMWVFAAWLDNADMRPANTLDAFVPVNEDGLGFVEHYWIDFGSALGSSAGVPKPADYGREYSIDWAKILFRTISFGATRGPWDPLALARFTCVGRFDAVAFDPRAWVPLNPARPFQLASPLDTFWAASILARFTEDDLRAVVAEARYPSTGATDYVVAVLRARQRALLRFAFERVLPLVDPTIHGDRLVMTDLAVTAGLIDQARYRATVRVEGGEARTTRAGRAEVRLGPGLPRDGFVSVTFERRGSPGSVEVELMTAGGRVLPVGITRPHPQ